MAREARAAKAAWWRRLKAVLPFLTSEEIEQGSSGLVVRRGVDDHFTFAIDPEEAGKPNYCMRHGRNEEAEAYWVVQFRPECREFTQAFPPVELWDRYPDVVVARFVQLRAEALGAMSLSPSWVVATPAGMLALAVGIKLECLWEQYCFQVRRGVDEVQRVRIQATHLCPGLCRGGPGRQVRMFQW